MTREFVAKALRCSTHIVPVMDCNSCPYLYREKSEAIKEFMAEHPEADKSFADPENWESCDVDRMALDAAQLLEEDARAENDGK